MTDERLREYRRFVEAATQHESEDGYLFEVPRCRFAPEPSDQLIAPPGARAVSLGEGAGIELPGGARLPLSGFTIENVRAVLAQLPCSYSRLNIELGAATASFMEQAFSRVLFAPAAVAELEAELPALEIVRFPGSPYEVVRSYWRNSCAVRRRLGEHDDLRDASELRALLLELHELLLLGESHAGGRSSFYLPASLLGRKRPAPGTFYEAQSVVERQGTDNVVTSGARVGVPLLGGRQYWQLLAESVADEDALGDARQLTVEGLELGRVVYARGPEETQPRPWFLPPRPLSERHFEALFAKWSSARAAETNADVAGAIAAWGAFHHYFVRIHPLPSGNQSLSMSFVNAALRRLLGAGIPHLLLDQLALRFQLSAYQRLFARAARAWSAPWPNAAERLRHLIRMRAELNDFVTAVGNAPTLIEARALISLRPHGAALALLSNE